VRVLLLSQVRDPPLKGPCDCRKPTYLQTDPGWGACLNIIKFPQNEEGGGDVTAKKMVGGHGGANRMVRRAPCSQVTAQETGAGGGGAADCQEDPGGPGAAKTPWLVAD
jgi:hypothetical protein